MRKENVDIEWEESSQISIAAKKNGTQQCLYIVIIDTKEAEHYVYFDSYINFILCNLCDQKRGFAFTGCFNFTED